RACRERDLRRPDLERERQLQLCRDRRPAEPRAGPGHLQLKHFRRARRHGCRDLDLEPASFGTAFVTGPNLTTLSNGDTPTVYDAGYGTHTIIGGAGADFLVAGWGPTTMTGGGAADTFVFNHSN